jgi:hypothetical protein
LTDIRKDKNIYLVSRVDSFGDQHYLMLR